MKEELLLSQIKKIAGDKYIGDDCAYLKELGLVVSQDSLVEDIHFSLKYITPYQLGYKSAMVNISDISASGGECKYMTVALSLPKDISTEFVEEFYKGLKSACGKVEIIGGDITGSDKIMISITVLGVDKGRKISSRSNAKNNQVVVVSGDHGSSSAGLRLLQANKQTPEKFIESHLMPKAQVEFGKNIAQNIKEDYAMMDTSDGLADALYKIAQTSGKTLVIDFEKIPYDRELEKIFPNEYKKMVLFGGEDYQIVATISEELAKELGCTIIGKVVERVDNIPVKIINGEDRFITNLEDCYNHFG